MSKGGASRTARANLRPWEMTVIVTGFPSKIAALQFEWAWHNPHITRKIPDEQRITFPMEKKKKSRRSGQVRKVKTRPDATLPNSLANLHLLLRVPGFTRWPLQVRFFCEDVHKVWQGYNERVAGGIGSRIKVLEDLKESEGVIDGNEIPMSCHAKGKRKREAIGKGGLDGLDIGYRELKGHVEKSISLLAEQEAPNCAVCSIPIGPKPTMALVCPSEGCRAVSHMTCLAAKFRAGEGNLALVVPALGKCPTCEADLQWVDLVKEMSLRASGPKEVAQLTKKARERKLKAPKAAKISGSQVERGDDKDDLDADPNSDLDEDPLQVGAAMDEDLPDDWHFQEDDDMMSVTSASGVSDIDAASPAKPAKTASKLGVVIEDSDWDDADVLE